jgi:cytochrome c553
MNHKTLIPAIALLATGGIALTGQQPEAPTVFTAAQAEAGRTLYENSCGRCHTYSLQGRKGEAGELPPAASLPPAYQKFIGNPNHVPPLAGKIFLSRWGQKTVAEVIDNFRKTANSPIFELDLSDDAIVNITAYILQQNGAKPGNQPLTKTTGVVLNSIIE